MQVHHHPTLADKPHVTENFRVLPAQSNDSTGHNTILAGFERKGQQWFVATELQSDLVVEVGDMHFHLHKFPLLSRSGKLNRLVFDSRDVQTSHIKLDGMPGGPEAFELASKFCYGVSVELTSDNVAALRCAAEYLEMTEELDEGNLVSKTEAYISFAVLPSWKESIIVLKNCEKLLPWAENLHIVRRCCESVAWKASTDPQGIRWSFTERTEALKGNHANSLWVGRPQNPNSNSITDQVPTDWWFEDISVVCISFFKKIIQAIRIKGMRQDLIGSAIVHYAIRWLPDLTKHSAAMEKELKEKELKEKDSNPSKDPSDVSWVEDDNRTMVETLVSILPVQKDAVPCAFLLRMLRLAKKLRIKAELTTDLEKRAGLLLDQGTLSDLMIPAFDPASDTLYDVDLVQRLLDCFLSQDFSQLTGNHSTSLSEHKTGPASPNSEQTPQQQLELAAKMRVAKLIDNYLVEVGGDQNLDVQKFLALAEALPEHTRATDDGLYKALDTYLKAHPHLTELDRKNLCRTLDCQRLSLDACMHAAQNERLPLRMVVQVLFGEQMKLRNAVTGTKDGVPVFGHEDESHSPGGSSHESAVSHQDKHHNHSECSSGHHHHSDRHHGSDGHLHPEESEEEIKTLRCDMEKMRGKFMALQHDYSAIQQQLEKLTKHSKHHKEAHHPKDHHHQKDHDHHKDHHHQSVWKKLIPHPHFHLPHLLTHPLEIFHHKDHHHHHKDHHRKDHHDHDDHHHQGKDSHHSHSHHGKGSHHHGHDSRSSPRDHHHEKDSRHHGKDSHHRDHDQRHDSHEHPYLPKGSRSFEEPRSSKDSTQSSHHEQHEQHRSSEARVSSSHLSSGGSSSRSKEDPSGPADIDEHKHHKHFPNPIKKWRNSIS
ncbi:hypothetical protein R1sor_007886 [Riccia sorocarpa]|uniref:Uncharacterized protein n=1 Tax=Riccia sorocarpa TaxID=122646 RepID=A0ABD3HVW5_9MARC